LSLPVIAFFNNKGGVGKTSLVYHLAWMFADLGWRALAVDLDPQANLTAAFLDEDQLENLWKDRDHPNTLYGAIQPLVKGMGDLAQPELQPMADGLALLAGDLALFEFEEEFSTHWPAAVSGNERTFRVLSAFWRIIQRAGAEYGADLVLADLAPSLGPINRAGLISADYLVIPLSPDSFCLPGLRSLGPSLWKLREDWKDRLDRKPRMDVELPRGEMRPLGYVVLQHGVRLDRPVKAYGQWINGIPGEYRTSVLREKDEHVPIGQDIYKLALLKHYRSLMQMALEARKPMFHLKPADGAIGAHLQSAHDAYNDFRALAAAIVEKASLNRASDYSQPELPLF
jgi:cellulose biosynthesis protein BcsQ